MNAALLEKFEDVPRIVVPEFPELTFDIGPHLYRLCGEVIPSVTQIMQPLSQKKYGGIREETLRKAAEKGEAVHEGCENWLKYGIEDVPLEYMGYFRAFKEWWSIRNPSLIGSEVRIYHKLYRYAGTVDLLVYIDGRLTLVDIKTTWNLEEKLCRTQLEAYAQALASHGITVEGKRILHLKRDGKWRDPQFPLKDTERLKVFQALKVVYDDLQVS